MSIVVTYKGESLPLESESADVGYEALRCAAIDVAGEKLTVGGHTGKTQIIISLPNLSSEFASEIKNIEAGFDYGMDAMQSVEGYIVLAEKPNEADKLAKELRFFRIVAPANDEFADYYGVNICGGSLSGCFTKALFIAAKDGTLFYKDVPKDLSTPFKEDKLAFTLSKAISCYTGVGCH